MKKAWIIAVLCVSLCGCGNTAQSKKSYSWYDDYTKGKVKMVIKKTNEYKNAMEFDFTYGSEDYSDFAYFSTHNKNKATCDLGEDGIIITFTKKDDIINVSTQGNFTYFSQDINGTYRRGS